jgi:polar amino acid transport system substrate-binding protein
MDEEENIIYPKWHFDADIVAAIYKKTPDFQWQGEKSLAGKNVGWIKGYGYNDYIDTKFNNKEFKTRAKGLKLLEKGRLDFFLDDQRELELEVAKGNVNADEFAYKTLMNLNIYPAFANNERGQQLSKIYDEGFAKLLEAGEIKKLYKKWNDPMFPFPSK